MTTFDPWGAFDEAQKEAESGGSYTPLPAGARDFTIYEHEIVPYSKKPGSPYADLYALSVTLRVPEGEEFATRRVYDRVPLFPKSPPNQKGESYVQYQFFSFFEKALGWSTDQLKAFALKIKNEDISGAIALLRGIDGTRINATLKVKPKDEYNPEGSNSVSRYAAASGAAAPSTAVAADAWAAAPASSSASTDVWATPQEDPELAAAAASSKGF